MPNHPGRRRARWIVPLVIALALAVGLVAFLNRPKPAKEPAYDKITLAASNQRQTVSLAGTLHPREQSVATFAVPGEVSSVHVKLGDKVVAGQPLAAVTTTDLDNAVTLAQANVDTAQAQLEAAQDNDKATRAQVNADARVQMSDADLRRDSASILHWTFLTSLGLSLTVLSLPMFGAASSAESGAPGWVGAAHWLGLAGALVGLVSALVSAGAVVARTVRASR